jgi:MATE family multidrug resistance protein
MWTIIGGNILNVFGNYVLIFGHFGMPELGLTGAGVSTLLARVASALVMWLVVTRSGKFHAYREGYRALEAAQASEMRRQIFRTSWPVMLQTGIECFLWALGAVVCGWYGKQQLAAYQVVLTISQLGFMTYMSVTTAVSIKVANYAGTHNVHSMRVTTRAGLHITLALATLASLLFILLGSWMVGGFTADAQVRSLARLLILPLVVYQYGDAIQMTFANALRGTGNVAPMLWISAVCYLIVGVPALMLLADILDLESVGVYYSFSVALFLAAYLYLRSFRLTLAGIAAHLQA